MFYCYFIIVLQSFFKEPNIYEKKTWIRVFTENAYNNRITLIDMNWRVALVMNESTIQLTADEDMFSQANGVLVDDDCQKFDANAKK